MPTTATSTMIAPHTRATTVAASMLALSLLCTRPGIFGELLTPLGLILALAAVLVLVAATHRIESSPLSVLILVLIGASQAWVVLRYSDIGADPGTQGMTILMVNLISASVVLGNRDAALKFGRIVVVATLVACASCAVTFVLWAVGVNVVLTQFFTGQWTADVRLPFTTTVGSVWVGGLSIPRFSALGREPGWTGMFITFAVVIWRYVGRPRWWGYLLLTIGMVCTVSTASFAVFVVVVAYEGFIRVRPYKHLAAGYGRHIFGAAMVGAALWVGIYAPVFGVASKTSVNALSLDERNTVTAAGWRTLTSLGLGQPVDTANSGIGLVASTTTYGWPYFVLMCCAFLVPLAFFQRGERPAAAVGTLFLTVLIAQPPQDSNGVYVLLLAAFACAPQSRVAGAHTAYRPMGRGSSLRNNDGDAKRNRVPTHKGSELA